MKKKGGKELTWPNTIHQSVFYLHARTFAVETASPRGSLLFLHSPFFPPFIPILSRFFPPSLPSFALENEISCSIAIHAHRVPTQFSFIECGSDVERGSRVRMFASLNRPTSMTSRNPSSASVD